MALCFVVFTAGLFCSCYSQIRHQLRDKRKHEDDELIMKFKFRALSAILEILTKVSEYTQHFTLLQWHGVMFV